MTLKIPTSIYGRNAEEDYKRVLARPDGTPPTPTGNTENLDGFILVPSINIYVAKERTLHNNNWDKTHELLQADNKRMLMVPEFWAFVKYLKTDYQDRNEENRIFDGIFKIRTDWAGEHLDAHFENKSDGMYVNSGHEFQNGILVPKHSEKLESCLTENCYQN